MLHNVGHRLRLMIKAGIGGAMIAPISASAVIDRRCPRCSGDSRTISTSRRRSLRTTSAARTIRFELIPAAIDDIV